MVGSEGTATRSDDGRRAAAKVRGCSRGPASGVLARRERPSHTAAGHLSAQDGLAVPFDTAAPQRPRQVDHHTSCASSSNSWRPPAGPAAAMLGICGGRSCRQPRRGWWLCAGRGVLLLLRRAAVEAGHCGACLPGPSLRPVWMIMITSTVSLLRGTTPPVRLGNAGRCGLVARGPVARRPAAGHAAAGADGCGGSGTGLGPQGRHLLTQGGSGACHLQQQGMHTFGRTT